jgi:hypothetical protein
VGGVPTVDVEDHVPVIPDDFSCICGVGLEEYTSIDAELRRRGISGGAEMSTFAESCGVPDGAWPDVQRGWSSRIARSIEVRTRHGVLRASS